MKLAVFHYHLSPGGVTDVIVLSSRALLAAREDIKEIRLVTGRTQGAGEVQERIRQGFHREIVDKVQLDILEEIDYSDGRSSPPDPQVLADRLEARYGEDTLWWVHNYHLGKNPGFTAALMKIAAAGSRQMILQIHDFPECTRFDNIQQLDKVLPAPPYPSGPHIRYAVINERDRGLLAEAGLGEEAVFRLDNPLSPVPLASADPEETRKALDERAGKEFPSWTPGAPFLFFPVRTIRRKNVLEAALMTRLLDPPVNLAVSLPGVSKTEKAYSDTVEGAFKEGLIKGAWGTGLVQDPRLSYPRVAAACDGVISSSVQEGFGYLFINALLWRKPLLARYLDVLDGFLHIFRDYPRRFWADFRIPPWEGLKSTIRERYKEKIAAFQGVLPERGLKSLTAAAEKLTAGGGIDVSFLTLEDQLEVLKKVKDDPGWRKAVQGLNKELLETVNLTLAARPGDFHQQIEDFFGEKAYCRSFAKLLGSLGKPVKTPDPFAVRNSLLKAFTRLDYFRLIYNMEES